MKLPWKETLFILLILILTISMNYLYVNQRYTRIIQKSELLRFIIVFLLSYITFSITFDDSQYSIAAKIMSSLFIALIFHFFMSKDAIILIPQEKTLQPVCNVDSDCVPAQCCHATETVHKLYAPDCSQVTCTKECRPGTMDCGYAEPKCDNGNCIVKYNYFEPKK